MAPTFISPGPAHRRGSAPPLARTHYSQLAPGEPFARALRSYYISEATFIERKDLLRTLDVRPPVIDGRVRVVEIEGFDTQACGGTHVHSTAHIGSVSIFRVDNKGKNNKRLYLRLADAEASA